MEEQIITQKQYKTLKFVRGWLIALFVISIIAAAIGLIAAVAVVVAFSAFSAFSNINIPQIPPQTWLALLGLIPIVINLIMIGALLFNKKTNRKNTISATMLVYTAISVAFGAFSLITGVSSAAVMNTGYSFYSSLVPNFSSMVGFMFIANILTFVCAAIYLFFAILLFRKARELPNRIFPYKLLFILYVVIIFASEYTILFFAMPVAAPWYIGIMITVSILMGFFTFMSLFPLIALYKALDDDAFYENFIVEHPGIAINRYEANMYRPLQTLAANRLNSPTLQTIGDTILNSPAKHPSAYLFCSKCGVPIAPDASFCRTCGTPVKPQEPKSQANNPLTGPEK
ncbi:MAG: zinc ribbon domain-containing protein [Eubacteriales bacterium]